MSAAPQSLNVNQPLKPRGFSAIVRGAQATLTWYDPNDATIEKYQYRRYHSDPWKDIDPSGPSTVTAAVTTNGRNEELRIRSVYPGNVNSPESERAAESNKAPEFSEGETTTRFVFSETPADQPIGVPVTATDAEGDTLTYSLSGTDAASFTIDTDNGQLKTSAGLDHATKSSYTVTVSVHDGKTSFGSYAQSVTGTDAIDDTIEVTITVKLAEPPAKPTGLTATAGWSSVKLAWEDPSNFTIEKYQLLQLQEAKVAASDGAQRNYFGTSVAVDGDTAVIGAYQDDDNGSDSGSAYVFVIQDWTDIPGSGAATTSHTVSGLTGDVDYTFQIRTVNGVGNSEASDSVGAIPAIGGEWSYETEVEPATITAGGGVAATTTFRAKFQADQTSLSSLSARVNTDGSISSGSSTNELPHFGWATAADSYDDTTPLSYATEVDPPVCSANVSAGTLTCETDFGNLLYARSTATSGDKTVIFLVEDDFTYTAVVNGSDSTTSTPTSTDLPDATLTVLPAAISTLSATSGDTAVVLSWTATGDSNITGYEFRQSIDGGTSWNPDWVEIAASTGSTTTHTVTELVNGRSYTFEIRAVNGSNKGAASNQVSATPAGTPLAPTDFTATGGDMSVILNWTAADDNGSPITKYQYQQKEDDGSFGSWTDISDSAPGGTNAVSYTVTSLTTGIVYTFKLRAVNGVGDGAESDEQTVTLPPAKPTGMTATAGHLQVTLAWGDPSDTTITGYQYQQTTATTTDAGSNVGDFSGLGWTDIPGANAGTTSHIVTGLTNGVTYYFKVRAGNPSGPGGATMYSAESDPASATTALGPPNAPTGLTATPSSTVTAVTLSWNDPSDSAITGYQYRQTKTAMAVLTWTADSAATGWQYHHSVDGGDTYGDWMDIAVDDATTADTTTITGVDPHLLNAFEVRPVKTAVEQLSVSIVQEISGDFTDSSWNTIDGATATTVSHEVSGLDLNNNTYYFEVRWVKAADVNGNVVVIVTHVGSIDLIWDDPQDDTITKYQYEL